MNRKISAALTTAVDVESIETIVVGFYLWGSRRQLIGPLAEVFYPGLLPTWCGTHTLSIPRVQVPLDKRSDACLPPRTSSFLDAHAAKCSRGQKSLMLRFLPLMNFIATAVHEPLNDLHVAMRRSNPQRGAIVDRSVIDNPRVHRVQHFCNVNPSLHARHVKRTGPIIARNVNIRTCGQVNYIHT